MSSDNSSSSPIRREREKEGTAAALHAAPMPDALRDLRGAQHPIKTIVLCGGPAAGKSLGLAAVATEVQRRTNYKVFCVPEAATLLVMGGLEWKDMNDERCIAYQLALLNTQIALEDNFRAVAQACGQPALILCDRGTMDGRSYCTPEQWDEICRRGGHNTPQLRDSRYDAVLHLVTCAIGAEQHYNLENNPARFESLDEAKVADLRVRQGWLGHPKIKLIENKEGGTFQDKLNAAVDFVFQCIGHAPPRHDKRRFLLPWDPLFNSVPIRHEVVTVTTTVLAQSTAENYSVIMLRQPASSSSNNNNNTAVAAAGATRLYLANSVHNDARSQHQIFLSTSEYNLLQEQRHRDHASIEKRNLAFESNGAFYDVAVHVSPPWIVGYATLYADGLQVDAPLPEFLQNAVETTHMSNLSSFHQSRQAMAKEIAEQLREVVSSSADRSKKQQQPQQQRQ